MRRTRIPSAGHHLDSARRQSGIALAVSLILLILVTLIGLAAVRGTTMQQKMTANFYDREIAFQNAEVAVRMGAAAISAGGTFIRNCGPGGLVCPANPFLDPNLDTSFIRVVTGGTGGFDLGAEADGRPEYIIENMGPYDDPETDTGFDQSANALQYGAQGTSLQSIYYRVTARNANPDDVGERAVVTLQSMYKQ